jgi:hypothetical protein
MLYATGMTEDDMNKAQVGICSVWYEGSTLLAQTKPAIVVLSGCPLPPNVSMCASLTPALLVSIIYQ